MKTTKNEKNDQLNKQLANQHVIDFMKLANIIARNAGCSIATSIIRGNENKVVSKTPYGYRKRTTGEYVSNAYRNKFGWKNTYYQNSETEVMIKC